MRALVSESKKAEKELDKAPKEIQASYEIWVRLLEGNGHEILRNFKGYHDEALKGQWVGHRSSRLNKQWRVIYTLDKMKTIQIVHVEKITPHDYRRKI